MKWRPIAYLGVFLAIFLFSAGAVEPLQLVLHNMETKMAGWRSLSVTGTRTIVNPDTGEGRRESFHLTITRPKGIRLEILETTGRPTHAAASLSEPVRRFLDVMLLSDDKARLFARLAEWGVAASPMGLSRLDRWICQIIGASEGRKDLPQFWIGKFDYFPARLILPVEERGRTTVYDIRMAGWDAPVSRELFPRLVEFYRDGLLLERWKLSGVSKG